MCNIIHGSEKPCQTDMVCTANDLITWKDFPKGLRVLLLDDNDDSETVITPLLEEMNYIVTTVCNVSEAMLALSNKLENFHIAIVEVNTNNNEEIFNFIEITKELPIIMISKIYCVSTIMKGISLGAVEFLQKPLSEEKLRNIWQHTIHKTSSINETAIKELKNDEPGNHIPVKLENEQVLNDKYPAPSTPQLEQGGRLLLGGDSQDQTNCCSLEKEIRDQDGECKSVEITFQNSDVEITFREEDMDERFEELPIKKNTENNKCINQKNIDNVSSLSSDTGIKSTKNCHHVRKSSGIRGNRKKLKVDWTSELHKKFVAAVEQLGVEQAIPSRILEVMKVEGLTRHNVASHLQKYRMHQRHILPKQHHHTTTTTNNNDDWWHNNFHYPRHPPIIGPYSQTTPPGGGEVGLVWGQPSIAAHGSGVELWGPSAHFLAWPTTESLHRNQYSAKIHADVWGCPVMMPPHLQYPNFQPLNTSYRVHSSFFMPQISLALHPGEDEIEKAVKEALMKPWSPLPIGLKPPSMDTVLVEFSKHDVFAAGIMDASNND